MHQTTNGPTPMKTKLPWTQPAIQVIDLNSARHGAASPTSDGQLHKS